MIDPVPIGIWWCPTCQTRTQYVSREDDIDKRADADLAECEHCFHNFGKRIDQAAAVCPDTGRRVTKVLSVLSIETVAKGKARLRAKQLKLRQGLGIPLRHDPKVTQELRRRRGW